MKTTLLAALLLAASVSGPALAQGGTSSSSTTQSATNPGQNTAVQKIFDHCLPGRTAMRRCPNAARRQHA